MKCSQRFLEKPDENTELNEVWKTHAVLCAKSDDTIGQIHALVAEAKCFEVSTNHVSKIANQINGITNSSGIDREELRVLLNDLISRFEECGNKTATDYSRLSWLYRNVGSHSNAVKAAKKGLVLEPENYFCQKILDS